MLGMGLSIISSVSGDTLFFRDRGYSFVSSTLQLHIIPSLSSVCVAAGLLRPDQLAPEKGMLVFGNELIDKPECGDWHCSVKPMVEADKDGSILFES
jgi:hypothetical protein